MKYKIHCPAAIEYIKYTLFIFFIGMLKMQAQPVPNYIYVDAKAAINTISTDCQIISFYTDSTNALERELWLKKEDLGFDIHNNVEVFEAVSVQGESSTRLKTIATNLDPNTAYYVYINFMSNSNDWGIKAGLTTNDLQLFLSDGTSPNVATYPTTYNGQPIDQNLGTLGIATTNADGKLEVFIAAASEDLAQLNTWYEGIALEKATAPFQHPPLALPDSIFAYKNNPITNTVLNNDSDIDGDNLQVNTTPIIPPANGTVILNGDGNYTYTPNVDYVGSDSFTYQICDDGTPLMCHASTVEITVQDCVNIELYAWLEGAYDPTLGEMRNALVSTRKLLPGQTPTSNLATPTPSGQPYHIAPWNYAGTEGTGWTNADYTGDETDWILVSFRTGTAKNTQVGMTAGLLMKDGSISFPNRCALTSDLASSVYIVLEHRNHIGVMTPQAIEVINGTLTYDFRFNDSYRDPTSFGQKQLPTGEWCLFAGDADQSDFPSFDIKGTDKTIWFDNNGVFDYYLSPDFNLDGDINGQDKSLWFDNNGISSRVPK